MWYGMYCSYGCEQKAKELADAKAEADAAQKKKEEADTQAKAATEQKAKDEADEKRRRTGCPAPR